MSPWPTTKRIWSATHHEYGDEDAHLNLLAVSHAAAQGIGAAIVSWLENSALTAGIGAIYLEARSANMQGASSTRTRIHEMRSRRVTTGARRRRADRQGPVAIA